ncbi:MAG: SDR family oxidoreductase, partial [Anaerolineales bacterium]|nr:SDR family oxidoreductase [Anaerolineales bacterium]
CIRKIHRISRYCFNKGITMPLRRDYPAAQELIKLTGKGALVTGGAAGIGYAIAYRLAEAGAKVLIVDVNGEKAVQASKELKSRGYWTESLACDITQEKAVENMARKAAGILGSIDVLVNNAGIYPRIPLAEMTEKNFDDVISVNLKGTLFCSRAAGQGMMAQGRGGCIINIASIEAMHSSGDGMSAYAASKGAVLALTKNLARELGKHDIRVNVIVPGAIATEGMRSMFSGPSSREARAQLKAFMSRMLLGRMGEADEIGRVALFLASASYITGSMVVVDGGYLVT